MKALNILTANAKKEGHVLLGVLGRRQLAPLCSMWYATRPDLRDLTQRDKITTKY